MHITVIIDIVYLSNRNDMHIQGLYFPSVYLALIPADISSSTIVSTLFLFLGKVSDGSDESSLELLRRLVIFSPYSRFPF